MASTTLRVAGAATLLAIGALTTLPILAVAIPAPDPCPNAEDVEQLGDDATPTILGPSRLTIAQLRTWWASTGKGQPRRLTIAIDDLIALYITEGNAEGVRGDRAFAQAILETGWFTNTDTTRNNYAGIAHYDHLATGAGYPTAQHGVRAQIQLLKKYAAGNTTPLAHPNIAPRAGARSTTWGGLARTWATNPNYWTALNRTYTSIAATITPGPPTQAATTPPDNKPPATTHTETTEPATTPRCTNPTGPTNPDGYALPVDRHWYEQHPDWFTKPHHDYPAADIPVPTATPLYAITTGTITATPTTGKCGIGIILTGNDGNQYTYCHGQPGTQHAHTGDHVTAGQHILNSGNTGNSTGPHLHLGITTNHTRRCPQPLLTAIATRTRIDATHLAATGCTH